MADPDIQRTFACGQCGNSHTVARGRLPAKLLCPPCRMAARNTDRIEAMGGMAAWNAYCRQQRERARASRVCPHCKSAPPRRYGTYCSDACQKEAGSEKIRARKGQGRIEEHRAARREAALRTCETCGQRFMRTGWANVSKFCSRDCSHAEARLAAEVRAEAMVYRLWGLGYGRGIAATKFQRWGQRARAACLVCAKPVGAGRTKTFPARYCSERCKAQTDAAREAKKTARKAGKARKRVATVESVNALRVFERDGWRCHLCGGLTAKAKRGTYDSRAPELDHIVPLSKGGPHSYANTACAHRKCNAAKSDKIMGQPSLLAA